MRRLRRILLNGATALSLLLCVGVVAAWARSRSVCDRVTLLDLPTFEGGCIVHPQGFYAYWLRRLWLGGDPYRPDAHWDVMSFPAYAVAPAIRRPAGTSWGGHPWRGGVRGGFGWEQHTYNVTWANDSGSGSSTLEWHGVLVPYWALTLATGLLPAIRVVRAAGRRLRKRPGLCSACGYDLRATPERCPECGKTATP